MPRSVIEQHIQECDPKVQPILTRIHQLIMGIAPEATQSLSWKMPTYVLHGNLVHFMAHKHHIGFYPGADGVAHFLPQLGAYHTSKGAIQFPLDQPIPYDLIEQITRFRMAQNIAAYEQKKASK